MAMSLVDKVASKVGSQISANSQPSITQVVEWLNEAYDYLRRNMPYEYFPKSQSSVSANVTAPEAKYVEIPDDYVRFIDVVNLESDIAYPANILSIQEYNDIKSGRNSYLSAKPHFPIATQMSGAFYMCGGASSASVSEVMVYYISGARSISDSQTTASENPIVDKMMIDYAVAQYSYSDEELQQWQGKVAEYGATEDVIKGNSQIRSKRLSKEERVALK